MTRCAITLFSALVTLTLATSPALGKAGAPEKGLKKARKV